MNFEFSHPGFLFGLLAVGLAVSVYRRSLIDFPKRQRLVSLALRSLILTLIVLALAGLSYRVVTHEKAVVCLSDESLSVDSAGSEERSKIIRDFQDAAEKNGIPFVVVPFATTPLPLPDHVSEEEAARLKTDAWRDGTDIASALKLSAALFPPDRVPSILLVTDGNQTSGDKIAASRKLGVPISPWPLPAPSSPEVQLASVRVPPNVRQGEPFHVEVTILSNRAAQGTVSVFRGDYRVIHETKPLHPGENRFQFQQTVDDQRQSVFLATVESSDDTILDNNADAGTVYAGGKPRVLLIERDLRDVRDFAAALREQGIDIETRPTEGIPKSMRDLENFDAVILSNVPATVMTTEQMEILRAFVSDLGGGLVTIGGDQSFGLGGYYKTPLEEVFPVRCHFEKEKEKPSLAICLVIDHSGSMGGDKMEMAKDAAKGTVELLTGRDYISVVAFDQEPFVIVPIQNAGSAASVNSMISTIQAQGGTNIYPALAEALSQLDRVSAKLKHVILLTDGYSQPGDFEGIVREMTHRQITVSTVGVGDADAPLLENLAQIGQGRFYACDNPSSIPQIFARETVLAGKSAIDEQPFVPQVISPSETLSGIDFDAAPPLLGFVITRPKPTSQFILSTEGGEPLLTWWRYGLGVSTAFTSDIKSRWGAEWLSWPDFPLFWAQVIRYSMRKADSLGSTIDVTRAGKRVTVRLDAVDENEDFINRGTGKITVIDPALKTEEITPTATAPGRYEATFEAAERGVYSLQTTLTADDHPVLSRSRGFMVGYSDELRLKETDHTSLKKMAEASGGMFRPDPIAFFREEPDRHAWKILPLWPYLLALALLLYVPDVYLRRVEIRRKEKGK